MGARNVVFPRYLLISTIAVSALAAAAVGLAGQPTGEALSAQAQQLPIEKIEFEPGRDISSATCGKCHEDIYNVWKASVHGNSFDDPIFQAGLAKAISMRGSEVAETCLTCHSPGTMLMQPALDAQGMAREGIGCRFCHAIRGADLGTFPPFDLETELVVYGKLDDLESPVHQIRRSEFLGSAEYCATCHEYTTPAGAPVLTTFSEFSGADQPSVLTCQDCHMPYVMGEVVLPTVKESGELQFVDSHAILGGRSIQQVRRAVDLEVVSVEERSGSVDVRVAVENQGAGHWIPTGMPSKYIVLEVSTAYADRQRSERVVFGRRIVDDAGNLLRTIPEIMTSGAAVQSDTRLRPGQRRDFRFTLPAPVDADTTLVVRLFYESTESPTLQAEMDDIHRIERGL